MSTKLQDQRAALLAGRDTLERQVSERTDSVGMMPAIRIVNDWSMAGDRIVDTASLTPEFVNPGCVAAVDRYRSLYGEGVMPPEGTQRLSLVISK